MEAGQHVYQVSFSFHDDKLRILRYVLLEIGNSHYRIGATSDPRSVVESGSDLGKMTFHATPHEAWNQYLMRNVRGIEGRVRGLYEELAALEQQKRLLLEIDYASLPIKEVSAGD